MGDGLQNPGVWNLTSGDTGITDPVVDTIGE